MNHRVILALVLSLCTLLSAMGQTKPADDKDDVVKITTNLVQVDAVVTKDGKVVRDLKAEDFEIYEDGRRQDITSFAFISNVDPNTTRTAQPKREKTEVAPPGPIERDVRRRTIAIVVDDLGLSAESMSQVRKQLRKFVAEELQPNDLVAIIRTGGEMGALQQFTNDKRLLTRAVDLLRWNVCSRIGIHVLPIRSNFPSMPGGCGGYSYGNTRRSLNFILDAMAELPGRKSMVVLSDSLPVEDQDDGLATNSEVAAFYARNYTAALRRIAEKAIRSSVVIYAVDTQGLQPTGVTAADSFSGNPQQVMQQMNSLISDRARLLQIRREGGDLIARQTGGFHVRNSNDYGLNRVAEDQTGYYLLGYRPTDETFNRKFHHIKAKVKRSGMSVRTRFGFFGVSEEDVRRARRTPQDLTNLALMSPFASQDIEVELASFFANDKTEGSLVRSFVYVDANGLTFTPVNDRQETSLEIHGVIFGDNGLVVHQVKHTATLKLRQEEYEKAKSVGIRLRFDMPAVRPGSFQVRIGVRDRTSSKIGTAGQFVAVPDLRNKKLALSGVVLRGAGEAGTQNITMTNPAIRQFKAGSDLYFAFVAYNAAIDPATQSPNLLMETKLFREGKMIKSSGETVLDLANQPDPVRLLATGVMRLDPALEPGPYYLQVVITDRAVKDKQPPAIQWVDFEIVK
ncbi:MAG TPA: VWA domain-containing protein [Pyrinomonadaceae bacterium]|nr:VWA domain-containing protein [Pyrinomonadaceae bacterium]